MRLGELATIKRGIFLDRNLLKKGSMIGGLDIAYLVPADFSGGEPLHVAQKDLNKYKIPKSALLQYGDLLLYRNKDTNAANKFKLHRYDNPSGQTLPSDDFWIIRSDFSIIKDYFSYESNKKDFYEKLAEKVNSSPDEILTFLHQIEIYTNNVTELEEPNEAEVLGLHEQLRAESIKDIRFTEKPIALYVLLKDIQDGLLSLDTDFQRRAGLWDIGKKSRLIESMILKLPIPAFYFDASNDDDKWRVIDGLQRLSTARDFISNKNFALTQLDYLPDLEGKKFDDLSRLQQRNIEQYAVFSYIVEKGTPKSVVYKMFKSINTSALTLDAQEIRHAINPGKPADFLKKVAELDWFKQFVPLSDRQRERMYDREIVLRFLAFSMTNYTAYKPSITDFLDQAMINLYDRRKEQLEEYATTLENTLQCIHKIWGEEAYSRRMFDPERAYRFNPIIFEVLTYTIAKLPETKQSFLFKNRTEAAKRIRSYFKNKPDAYWETEKAYTQEGLIARFSDLEQQIKSLTT